MVNILFDPAGGVLQHNVVTDTLVLVTGLVFAAWFCLTAVVSVPVLVAYGYLPLLLWAPVALVYLQVKFKGEVWPGPFEGALKNRWSGDTARHPPKPSIALLEAMFDERLRKALPDRGPAEVLGTKLMLMRLVYLTLFATLVFGVRLWPLYTGNVNYIDLLRDTTRGMAVSLSFWRPSWRLGLWWPSELPNVDQIALASSLVLIVFEYGQLVFVWAMDRAVPGNVGGPFRYRPAPAVETDDDAVTAETAVGPSITQAVP